MNAGFDVWGMLPVGSANVLSMALDADISGKVIVLLLFGGSVLVWTLMLSKFVALRQAEQSAQLFLKRYRGASHPMALFLKDSRLRGSSPLQAVYDHACSALDTSIESQGVVVADLLSSPAGGERKVIEKRQIRSAKGAAERMVADQALMLEASMGYLASATSTAPFLGLLGTVWGVMNAFASMAGSGTALLSDVAPGISSALLTTVVGLIVALPSSIGYNILSDRIRRLTVMLDNFAQELTGDLDRVHGQ